MQARASSKVCKRIKHREKHRTLPGPWGSDSPGATEGLLDGRLPTGPPSLAPRRSCCPATFTDGAWPVTPVRRPLLWCLGSWLVSKPHLLRRGKANVEERALSSGARDVGNAETSPRLPTAPALGPSGDTPTRRLSIRSVPDSALPSDQTQSGSELARGETGETESVILVCMNFQPNRNRR